MDRIGHYKLGFLRRFIRLISASFSFVYILNLFSFLSFWMPTTASATDEDTWKSNYASVMKVGASCFDSFSPSYQSSALSMTSETFGLFGTPSSKPKAFEIAEHFPLADTTSLYRRTQAILASELAYEQTRFAETFGRKLIPASSSPIATHAYQAAQTLRSWETSQKISYPTVISPEQVASEMAYVNQNLSKINQVCSSRHTTYTKLMNAYQNKSLQNSLVNPEITQLLHPERFSTAEILAMEKQHKEDQQNQVQQLQAFIKTYKPTAPSPGSLVGSVAPTPHLQVPADIQTQIRTRLQQERDQGAIESTFYSFLNETSSLSFLLTHKTSLSTSIGTLDPVACVEKGQQLKLIPNDHLIAVSILEQEQTFQKTMKEVVRDVPPFQATEQLQQLIQANPVPVRLALEVQPQVKDARHVCQMIQQIDQTTRNQEMASDIAMTVPGFEWFGAASNLMRVTGLIARSYMLLNSAAARQSAQNLIQKINQGMLAREIPSTQGQQTIDKIKEQRPTLLALAVQTALTVGGLSNVSRMIRYESQLQNLGRFEGGGTQVIENPSTQLTSQEILDPSKNITLWNKDGTGTLQQSNEGTVPSGNAGTGTQPQGPKGAGGGGLGTLEKVTPKTQLGSKLEVTSEGKLVAPTKNLTLQNRAQLPILGEAQVQNPMMASIRNFFGFKNENILAPQKITNEDDQETNPAQEETNKLLERHQRAIDLINSKTFDPEYYFEILMISESLDEKGKRTEQGQAARDLLDGTFKSSDIPSLLSSLAKVTDEKVLTTVIGDIGRFLQFHVINDENLKTQIIEALKPLYKIGARNRKPFDPIRQRLDAIVSGLNQSQHNGLENPYTSIKDSEYSRIKGNHFPTSERSFTNLIGLKQSSLPPAAESFKVIHSSLTNHSQNKTFFPFIPEWLHSMIAHVVGDNVPKDSDKNLSPDEKRIRRLRNRSQEAVDLLLSGGVYNPELKTELCELARSGSANIQRMARELLKNVDCINRDYYSYTQIGFQKNRSLSDQTHFHDFLASVSTDEKQTYLHIFLLFEQFLKHQNQDAVSKSEIELIEKLILLDNVVGFVAREWYCDHFQLPISTNLNQPFRNENRSYIISKINLFSQFDDPLGLQARQWLVTSKVENNKLGNTAYHASYDDYLFSPITDISSEYLPVGSPMRWVYLNNLQFEASAITKSDLDEFSRYLVSTGKIDTILTMLEKFSLPNVNRFDDFLRLYTLISQIPPTNFALKDKAAFALREYERRTFGLEREDIEYWTNALMDIEFLSPMRMNGRLETGLNKIFDEISSDSNVTTEAAQYLSHLNPDQKKAYAGLIRNLKGYVFSYGIPQDRHHDAANLLEKTAAKLQNGRILMKIYQTQSEVLERAIALGEKFLGQTQTNYQFLSENEGLIRQLDRMVYQIHIDNERDPIHKNDRLELLAYYLTKMFIDVHAKIAHPTYFESVQQLNLVGVFESQSKPEVRSNLKLISSGGLTDSEQHIWDDVKSLNLVDHMKPVNYVTSTYEHTNVRTLKTSSGSYYVAGAFNLRESDQVDRYADIDQSAYLLEKFLIPEYSIPSILVKDGNKKLFIKEAAKNELHIHYISPLKDQNGNPTNHFETIPSLQRLIESEVSQYPLSQEEYIAMSRKLSNGAVQFQIPDGIFLFDIVTGQILERSSTHNIAVVDYPFNQSLKLEDLPFVLSPNPTHYKVYDHRKAFTDVTKFLDPKIPRQQDMVESDEFIHDLIQFSKEIDPTAIVQRYFPGSGHVDSIYEFVKIVALRNPEFIQKLLKLNDKLTSDLFKDSLRPEEISHFQHNRKLLLDLIGAHEIGANSFTESVDYFHQMLGQVVSTANYYMHQFVNWFESGDVVLTDRMIENLNEKMVQSGHATNMFSDFTKIHPDFYRQLVNYVKKPLWYPEGNPPTYAQKIAIGWIGQYGQGTEEQKAREYLSNVKALHGHIHELLVDAFKLYLQSPYQTQFSKTYQEKTGTLRIDILNNQIKLTETSQNITEPVFSFSFSYADLAKLTRSGSEAARIDNPRLTLFVTKDNRTYSSNYFTRADMINLMLYVIEDVLKFDVTQIHETWSSKDNSDMYKEFSMAEKSGSNPYHATLKTGAGKLYEDIGYRFQRVVEHPIASSSDRTIEVEFDKDDSVLQEKLLDEHANYFRTLMENSEFHKTYKQSFEILLSGLDYSQLHFIDTAINEVMKTPTEITLDNKTFTIKGAIIYALDQGKIEVAKNWILYPFRNSISRDVFDPQMAENISKRFQEKYYHPYVITNPFLLLSRLSNVQHAGPTDQELQNSALDDHIVFLYNELTMDFDLAERFQYQMNYRDRFAENFITYFSGLSFSQLKTFGLALDHGDLPSFSIVLSAKETRKYLLGLMQGRSTEGLLLENRDKILSEDLIGIVTSSTEPENRVVRLERYELEYRFKHPGQMPYNVYRQKSWEPDIEPEERLLLAKFTSKSGLEINPETTYHKPVTEAITTDISQMLDNYPKTPDYWNGNYKQYGEFKNFLRVLSPFDGFGKILITSEDNFSVQRSNAISYKPVFTLQYETQTQASGPVRFKILPEIPWTTDNITQYKDIYLDIYHSNYTYLGLGNIEDVIFGSPNFKPPTQAEIFDRIEKRRSFYNEIIQAVRAKNNPNVEIAFHKIWYTLRYPLMQSILPTDQTTPWSTTFLSTISTPEWNQIIGDIRDNPILAHLSPKDQSKEEYRAAIDIIDAKAIKYRNWLP